MIISLSRKTDIPALTGLRLFAALSVCVAHLLSHVYAITASEPAWALEMSRLSAEGMTLFFVLSGFVIHYNYGTFLQQHVKLGTYHFLIARLARLWPLYFICLGLDLIRQLVQFTPIHWLALPYYLTLTQSWFYYPMAGKALVYQWGPMPSIAWSVSTEWFFYLCYPLLCLALLKIDTIFKKIVFMLAVSVFIIVTVAKLSINIDAINTVASHHFGPIGDFNLHPDDSFFRWLIYFSPYARLGEFIIGCLIAALYQELATKNPTHSEARYGFILLCTAFVGLVGAHYLIFHSSTYPHLQWLIQLHRCGGFTPFFAIIIFCCARYQNSFSQFFSWPLLIAGGEMSYSIYLLHPPIASICFHYLHNNTTSLWIAFGLALSLILTVAHFSYRYIEKPARSLLRKQLGFLIHPSSKQDTTYIESFISIPRDTKE